ncbi:MAG TPA: Hsp20/alpha crystallin family protein [Anaerolineae bacterium]|nr:Hsp20/alpha crystallin family protein [Anaerolineae bacterium]
MTNVQRQQREARDASFWPESEARRQMGNRPARREARVFPSIIVSAAKDRLLVRAEMPGIDLEHLELSVSGDVLSMQGIRLTGEDLEGGWYHRRERESGGFSRAVRLPAEVDGDNTEASYQAGVLTVTVPLRQEARPRQVPIKVAEG